MKNRCREKRLWALVAVYLVLFLFTGCSTKKESSENEVVRIKYSNWEWSIEQLKLMRQIVEEFNSSNADVEVILNTPSDHQKILTEMAGNVSPDVFFWGVTASLVQKKAIIDLKPLARKYNYDLSQFFDGAVETFTYGEGIYALPLNMSTVCLAYNKDIFDKAQLDYPGEDWDWEDYARVAKRLTRDFDGDGRKDQFGTLLPGWTELLVSNGERLYISKAGNGAAV